MSGSRMFSRVGGILLLSGFAAFGAVVPASAAPAAPAQVAPSAASAAEVAAPAEVPTVQATPEVAPTLTAAGGFASDGGSGGVAARAAAPCPYADTPHAVLYQGIQYQTALVKHLQCLINLRNPGSLLVDGNFGLRTKQAVQYFQGNHGLLKDGEVGPITWKHLHPDTDAGLH